MSLSIDVHSNVMTLWQMLKSDDQSMQCTTALHFVEYLEPLLYTNGIFPPWLQFLAAGTVLNLAICSSCSTWSFAHFLSQTAKTSLGTRTGLSIFLDKAASFRDKGVFWDCPAHFGTLGNYAISEGPVTHAHTTPHTQNMHTHCSNCCSYWTLSYKVLASACNCAWQPVYIPWSCSECAPEEWEEPGAGGLQWLCCRNTLWHHCSVCCSNHCH